MLTLITDHFRNIKKNICCTKLFVKNIPKILSFILLDDHLSNSLFKFNALWNRTFFDGLGILKPQYISFYIIYNSACNNKTPTEVSKSILMHSTIMVSHPESCLFRLIINNMIFCLIETAINKKGTHKKKKNVFSTEASIKYFIQFYLIKSCLNT
jgi:hypothetical protein